MNRILGFIGRKTTMNIEKKKIKSGRKKLKILDIGCGNRKVKNSIGMDISKDTEADIIHDMNKYPYPFKKNEFDIIYMNHTLEHLRNYVEKKLVKEGWERCFPEIKRILKPNGILKIRVPHFSSMNAYGEHDHYTRWSLVKLRNIVIDNGFEITSMKFSWCAYPENPVKKIMNIVVNPIININHWFTERLFCYYLGGISEVSFIVKLK